MPTFPIPGYGKVRFFRNKLLNFAGLNCVALA
jgi:hypothetical protein